MSRLPRIVIPDVPHHVTQRGNRRMPVFFCDEDRCEYLRLVAEAAEAGDTRCLAWCLMDNHVHLVLVPTDEDGLRATLGEVLGKWGAGQESTRELSAVDERSCRSAAACDDKARGRNGHSAL